MNVKSKWHALMLILRFVCYLTLATVILSFTLIAVLPAVGACSSITTGGISCSSPLSKELAEIGLGMVLLTVFTGVPALFAMAGVIFSLHDIYLWSMRRSGAEAKNIPISDDDVQSSQVGRKPGFLVFLLKAFGLLMAAIFALGIIAGIVG